ncbi:MAG: hypothetical protein HY700_13045 [Gemmatimonadetes bacterium]|nr:hypothetical protein [Gemmatimonadota bacterium]
MPVTAKLSRKFYETFGDDITNELVEWLNQVDATYRSDLRELNELNFARFDAKLEQRVVQLDAKIDRLAAQLRAEMQGMEGRLIGAMHNMKAELLKWMFGTIFAAWATLLGAMIALIKLG